MRQWHEVMSRLPAAHRGVSSSSNGEGDVFLIAGRHPVSSEALDSCQERYPDIVGMALPSHRHTRHAYTPVTNGQLFCV